MFKFSLDVVKQPENLSQIIALFQQNEQRRFARLERYYMAENEILNRTVLDEKPNNKLAHCFGRYISNMATGYFMGKGVRLEVPDEEYKLTLMEILDANQTDNTNFEIAKEASKKGVAFEILYINEKSELKTKKLKAEDVIPVYSPDLGKFLECAIRLWSVRTSVTSLIPDMEYAELYTDTEIYSYSKRPAEQVYTLDGVKAHNLGDIPVIVYWNNEEQTGDYENIISLVDAYDKAQSDTANDNEYFTDAYLVLIGAGGGVTNGDGDDEDTASAYRDMRRERVIHLDEQGQAEWLTKNVNDSAQENYKNRIYKDIFFLSQVPALSDESFAGNLTGVALRYKLIGMEQLSIMKQNKFFSAQKKKLRIITDYINLKFNRGYDADTIVLHCERNFIDNIAEAIQNVVQLDGIISHETQLQNIPYVADPVKELEKIREEQTQKEGLPKIPKGFNIATDDTEDGEQ
ncbi:MAG: phage portal protein [Defluviitaleaceae bacterium]|nr:phage portal protein [Defluviitaleaceae bacterium]